ncbi:MAG: sugar ABC transporter permease [Anaerolineae bacterium]|nr:sugar ABC transporter permease [Anaerolineae bacterium]
MAQTRTVPVAKAGKGAEAQVVTRRKARKGERERQENLIGYLFLSPWLIGFFLFTLLPILASLVLAFTDYNLFSTPRWTGLANFERMFFGDRRYWRSVKATFQYVLTAVPLRLVVALGIAMLLNRGRRFISLYRAAYYAPSIVGGSVAVAVMWRQVWGGQNQGLVNHILQAVGLPHVNWLANPATAIWTLVILAAWQFGSPMLIFLAGLKQIPIEYYEAASIDGAGAWARFASITLPLLTPVILFNLVMQMISGFLVFTQAYLVTGGRPLDSTLFYALYLYLRAFEVHEMGYGSAMAWVLLLIIAFFTALVFRSSTGWVYYESAGGRA